MLGLDLGEARIGVAISDPTGTVCTPLDAIVRSGSDSDALQVADIARRESAAGIVLGLPVTMEGRRGSKAAEASAFRAVLQAATELPVYLWDERLTTVEAESRMRQAGQKPSRNRGRVDSLAATIILESFLQARRK